MTIIYQYRVASTSLGGFLKLLKAWKGSVYKLLYKELLIFVSLYAVISIVYRFALNEDQKLVFEGIVIELYGSTSAIPLSFLLGFYVTFIAQRWWQQFTNVPWPDRTLFTMTTYLHGFDDRARMMRRAVARYMLFGLIWICRAISVTVMKRFPTLDHIVEAGFITKEEKAIFEGTECKYQKFFVPLSWANQVLVTARRENKIETDFGLRMILQPLADFRDKCSLCFIFDWITVPLVYTQVVTFATYSYFAVSLFGQQYLDPSKNYKGFELDFYIPGFSILQFLFYMGWLKVAEQMINPFGEDDDDFDINWLLDRHTTVAFTLVDRIYGKHPEFVRDGFWNDVTPDVPYTEASAGSIRPLFVGSTFNISPSHTENERMLLPDLDNINQHEWRSRNQGRGSVTESLHSLFPFRHLHHHSREDSEATLDSIGSGGGGHGRVLSNGRIYYSALDKEDGGGGGHRMRRSSLDIPRRERANTDGDFTRRDVRDRKFSLPFAIHFHPKNKQKRMEPAQTVSSPATSRFTVQPVKEEDLPVTDPSVPSNKSRWPGHSASPFQNVFSRVPALSAIEEGCTITSMKELINGPALAHDSDETDSDSLDGGVLSDDSKAYEDCISYVDETNHQSPADQDRSVLTSSSDRSTATETDLTLLDNKKTTSSPDQDTTKNRPASVEAPARQAQATASTSATIIPATPQSYLENTQRNRTTAESRNGELISTLNDDLLSSQPLLPDARSRSEVKQSPKFVRSKRGQSGNDGEQAPLIQIEEC